MASEMRFVPYRSTFFRHALCKKANKNDICQNKLHADELFTSDTCKFSLRPNNHCISIYNVQE